MREAGRRHGCASVWAGMAMMLTGTARALVVIEDSGPTEPAAPYLEILQAVPEDAHERPINLPSLGPADLRELLPIHSTDLTPGPVASVSVRRPFISPLFIIGSDQQSLRWVRARKDQLVPLGAIGLVVELPDVGALAKVLNATRGLSLIPASGSDLARNLELRHYPALITQDGVSQ